MITTNGYPTNGFPLIDLMLSWQQNYLKAVSTMLTPAAPPSRALVPVAPAKRGVENGERVVALGEETFQVDKKVVEGEKTQVRRFVVHRPVSADVKLTAKTVTIERRKPVDLTGLGDILTEETIEVRDTTEVPVVSKGVRIVEEVVIREHETVSVQTVKDTVKRDEVRIDQPSRQLVPTKKPQQSQQQHSA